MAEPIYIDMEPSWEACAHIYMLVMERGETPQSREDARQGILDMARKLDVVRQAQKQEGWMRRIWIMGIVGLSLGIGLLLGAVTILALVR